MEEGAQNHKLWEGNTSGLEDSTQVPKNDVLGLYPAKISLIVNYGNPT